jgi:hypothetical protein
MHNSFKIIKFNFTLCCSTCFGHHCVHHQELHIAAHEVSGHRVVLGRLFPPALFCNNRTRREETTNPTPHGDQTCFGHHCVYHQELLIAAHAGSRLFPPALFCNNRTRLEETTDPTPHADQRLHVQQ